MSKTVWVELGPDAAKWYDGNQPIDGRPHKQTNAGHVHWALIDEIHEWLVNHKQAYDIAFIGTDNAYLFNYRWSVRINDPKLAVLFKLTFA